MLFAPLTALNSSHLITKGDFGFFFAQLVILTPVQFAIGYIAGWVRGRFFSGNNQKTLQELSSSALAPKRVFTPVPDEEGAYARAADELETNQVDKATWARAFADADGDADKTKARYIALRVKKLIGHPPVQASITRGALHSSAAEQPAAIDTGNNQKPQDEKDRLWKLAQEQALGHGAGVSATHATGPSVAQGSVAANNNLRTDNPHQSNASDITALYKAVIGELRNVTLLMLVGVAGTATFMTVLMPQYYGDGFSYAYNLGYWIGVAVGNRDSSAVSGAALILGAMLPTAIYLMQKIYRRGH
jgi:hypothetical protein